MRWTVLISVFALTGCSWEGRLGNPPSQIVVPPGDKVVEEPNGAVVAEPDKPPIETVLTGLSQAQQTRTLVRQLAR